MPCCSESYTAAELKQYASLLICSTTSRKHQSSCSALPNLAGEQAAIAFLRAFRRARKEDLHLFYRESGFRVTASFPQHAKRRDRLLDRTVTMLLLLLINSLIAFRSAQLS